MARDDEFVMQCALFDLIGKSALTRDLPIYAVPNFAGHFGTAQSRIIAGAKAKRSGRRKGVPDICVDVARGAYHGLRLELKTPTGTVKPEQREWHTLLAAHGYAVAVCRSAPEGWSVLVGYLTSGVIPDPPQRGKTPKPPRGVGKGSPIK